MSLFNTQINGLVTAIAEDIRIIRLLQGSSTTIPPEYPDLTSAIAALDTKIVALIADITILRNTPAVTVNDTATASTTATYSVDKILALLAQARADVKADILGGASAAYDTLLEVQNRLLAEDSALASLLAAVGNRVRFDAPQTLNPTQQMQVLTNIGAASSAGVGNTGIGLLIAYRAAKG